MNQVHRQPPRPPGNGQVLSRPEAQDAIRDAVEILRARHRVGDTSAYTILVQAAVDARRTVRETALLVVNRTDRETA